MLYLPLPMTLLYGPGHVMYPLESVSNKPFFFLISLMVIVEVCFAVIIGSTRASLTTTLAPVWAMSVGAHHKLYSPRGVPHIPS